MQALQKLVEGNEDYPPSIILWNQMLELIKEEKQEDNLEIIQAEIEREINRYKPGLPEPLLARVFYDGKYYYLDPRGNLYRSDPGNPMVGNLVGSIHTNDKDETVVTIDKRDVLILPQFDFEERQIYSKKYYLDSSRGVYRGLHPGQKLVYRIGKLNQEGKIEL